MSAPIRPIVPARAALEAIDAVLQRAGEIAVRVSIVVVDRGGAPVAFLREEDALPATGELALAKARTAAAFARPSDALSPAVQPGSGFFGLAHALPWATATFAGGVPLLADGHVYGAVGVSGGSAEQDADLAALGADVVTTHRAGEDS